MIPGTGWGGGGSARGVSEITLVVGGTTVRCSVECEDDQCIVRVGGVTYRLTLTSLEPGMLRFFTSGRSQIVRVAHTQARSFLHMDGSTLEYTTAAAGDPSARVGARDDLSAPMPGAITQVLIREGDAVVRGQPLVIVEAMKMEHVIRAPRGGRIRVVRARPGAQVDAGAVLVEIAGERDEPPR